MNAKNAKTCLLTALLAATAIPAAATGPAGRADPAGNGALPVPANRIVGLWTTVGQVSACGNPAAPVINVTNTLLFHAGGTLTENAGLSRTTGPGRTFGLGTWRYDPRRRRYTLFLRFDHFLDGVYTGFATVDRELDLSHDGNIATGVVVSTRYNTAGEQIGQQCGSAVSIRL